MAEDKERKEQPTQEEKGEKGGAAETEVPPMGPGFESADEEGRTHGVHEHEKQPDEEVSGTGGAGSAATESGAGPAGTP